MTNLLMTNDKLKKTIKMMKAKSLLFVLCSKYY